MLQTTLFPDAEPLPPTERPLGPRCRLLQDGDVVTVVVAGTPLMRFSTKDRVDRRIAAALIADVKAAPVLGILEAFEMDDATLWRDRQRLQEGGVAALSRVRVGRAPGSTLAPAIARRVVELRETCPRGGPGWFGAGGAHPGRDGQNLHVRHMRETTQRATERDPGERPYVAAPGPRGPGPATGG